MKKTIARIGSTLGTTGKIFIACFLFYFITKTLGHTKA